MVFQTGRKPISEAHNRQETPLFCKEYRTSCLKANHAMNKAAYLAFALLGVIWGSNFIFMKWAAEDISPSQIVLLRVVFGFLPVFFFALAKRALRWKHIRYVHHFVVMSLLATAVYYLAFAKGTALLPSSIAGLLSGAIPLFTFICAWLFLSEEYIDMTKAAGVALGFLGVVLIARPWSGSGAIDIFGVACCLRLKQLSYAESSGNGCPCWCFSIGDGNGLCECSAAVVTYILCYPAIGVCTAACCCNKRSACFCISNRSWTVICCNWC